MPEARHVSVSIAVAPEEVYRFASNVANLSKWAPAFTGTGPVKVRFAAPNTQRVLDHWVALENGGEVYVPGRVLPNGTGSEVVLTFFRPEGMSDEDFENDVEMVESDLENLKKLLESGVREPAAPKAPAAPPYTKSAYASKTPYEAPAYDKPAFEKKPWEKKPFDRAQGKPWEKRGPGGPPATPNPNNLFVGGIPFELQEAELEKTFSACGRIAKLRLLTDKETGKSKGLAFVEMADADGAAKALKLNGTEIAGRKIFVTQAKPPEQREARPEGRKPSGFGKKPWDKKPFGRAQGGPPGAPRGKSQRDFRSMDDENKKPWEPRAHEKKAFAKKGRPPTKPFQKFRKRP